MSQNLQMDLTYNGSDANNHLLDLYDAGQALVAFQRSLALTTHLVINDQLITQATSLKGARIFIAAPAEGSWKAKAIVFGILGAGTISKDSPTGNLISSAYDFMIRESLGFHVDYDSTLGAQYERYEREKEKVKVLSRGRLDGLIEKCEPAVRDMHRPIQFSMTAEIGKFGSNVKGHHSIGVILNSETAEYIYTSKVGETPENFVGQVTMYNAQTFKGRAYFKREDRILGFFLRESCRKASDILRITNSLTANTQEQLRQTPAARVKFRAVPITATSGRLKSIHVDSIV